MVSEETIPPYAIFLSRVPCRIPSRKIKKTTYFKLTLPNTGIDLKLVYGIRNSLAFLLPVCTMIHTCKQMGNDADFTKVKKLFKLQNLMLKLQGSGTHCASPKKRTRATKRRVQISKLRLFKPP